MFSNWGMRTLILAIAEVNSLKVLCIIMHLKHKFPLCLFTVIGLGISTMQLQRKAFFWTRDLLLFCWQWLRLNFSATVSVQMIYSQNNQFLSFLFVFFYGVGTLLWSWIHILTPPDDATNNHQSFLIRKSVRQTEVQECSLGQHPPVTACQGVQSKESQSILGKEFDLSTKMSKWHVDRKTILCIFVYQMWVDVKTVTYLPISMYNPSEFWKLQSIQIHSKCMLRTNWNEWRHVCTRVVWKYIRLFYVMNKRIHGHKHICLSYMFSWQNVNGWELSIINDTLESCYTVQKKQ